MRFKDNFRQLAIEVLQGETLVDDDPTLSTKSSSNNLIGQTANKQDSVNASLNLNLPVDETAQAEREENVKQVVSDCRKLLVDHDEDCYGSWALINVTEYYK